MFKIGVHLPAGEYKLAVIDNPMGLGYSAVLKDSTNTIDSIITNDNFEGEKYITVEDGQYLKLSAAKIVE